MRAPSVCPSNSRRWDALRNRRSSGGGAFVYGVITTGVYCRPTCPSRVPLRRNVRFFDSPAEAERCGFRACRRCRPDVREDSPRAALVARVRALIDASPVAPPLAELARETGLSRYHLQRVFKRALGLTPKRYDLARRTQRFRDELRKEKTVTRAIYRAGYGSSQRAYAGARQRLGMTPRAYQRGGEGATIGYATLRTELGAVLVAATRAGVCAIELADDPGELVRRLAEIFPRATRVADDPRAQKYAAQLAEFVRSPRRPPTLPLELHGSEFQIRVWEALCRIRPGKTATYQQIARAIGAPKAARAIGRACAGNRLALAVPCHRVVRGDGSIGGYRWGTQRKRELLRREAESHAARE